MTRIHGWVCGRRCRESLHPSSSTVVRLVASGLRTEQHSAQQLLRGSARWPAVPVDGGLLPAVPTEYAVGVIIGGQTRADFFKSLHESAKSASGERFADFLQAFFY
jgi:hypothetical protein